MEQREIIVLKRKGNTETFELSKIKKVLMSIYNNIEQKDKIDITLEDIEKILENIIKEIYTLEKNEINYTEIDDIVWKQLSFY
jgi:transcriptional regulator NrdR family protein